MGEHEKGVLEKADHPLTNALARDGLSFVAVFMLDALPANIRDKLASKIEKGQYNQLILVAHAGTAFWQALQRSVPRAADPVDNFTRERVTRVLDDAAQCRRYEILYPGSVRVDLQALGALAGWHHASPFWVGIHPQYGTWFAYRSLIIADSDFVPTTRQVLTSPCADCPEQPCISACPASAMQNHCFDIDRCIQYRTRSDSACRYQCLARNACPVGREHRYDDAQMRHHYSASLKFLEAHVRNDR